jgi:hypothetical protein
MFAIIITLVITLIISVIWFNGIDSAEKYRKENPTYKGHEFLNWDDEKDELVKNDDFDHSSHTEGSF